MATVTFFFADQAGSTAQLERLGDAGAKGVRQALIDMLRQAAEDHHGEVVDHTGDGLMITAQVLVSDVTRALVAPRRAHRFSPLGERALKGIAEPVAVAAVDWAPEETEFALPEVLAAAAAGPFVGRAGELEWDNGTVSLWDLDSRRQLGRPLAGHTALALGVVVADGDDTLITSSWDGSVIFWDLRPASWETKACALAGRNLTRDEWRQFVVGDYRRTCPQWPEGVA